MTQFKSAARSQQFLNYEANYSTRYSAKGFLPTGGGEPEQMTPEQQRAVLVAKVEGLKAEAATFGTNNPRRIRLGQQIASLQEQIHALRPKIKLGTGVAHFFVDVAREKLSGLQFRQFMDEASKRFKQAKGRQ